MQMQREYRQDVAPAVIGDQVEDAVAVVEIERHPHRRRHRLAETGMPAQRRDFLARRAGPIDAGHGRCGRNALHRAVLRAQVLDEAPHAAIGMYPDFDTLRRILAITRLTIIGTGTRSSTTTSPVGAKATASPSSTSAPRTPKSCRACRPVRPLPHFGESRAAFANGVWG
jgi:hypothetical protein